MTKDSKGITESVSSELLEVDWQPDPIDFDKHLDSGGHPLDFYKNAPTCDSCNNSVTDYMLDNSLQGRGDADFVKMFHYQDEEGAGIVCERCIPLTERFTGGATA